MTDEELSFNERFPWLEKYQDRYGRFELSHQLILADVIIELIKTIKEIVN